MLFLVQAGVCELREGVTMVLGVFDLTGLRFEVKSGQKRVF